MGKKSSNTAAKKPQQFLKKEKKTTTDANGNVDADSFLGQVDECMLFI
jgi:hypothetical protein